METKKKEERKQTMWLVTYRVKGTNTIIGPIWEVPSKIKPVRWAKQAFEGDYDITYENTGMTPREYEDAQD